MTDDERALLLTLARVMLDSGRGQVAQLRSEGNVNMNLIASAAAAWCTNLENLIHRVTDCASLRD